MKWFDVNEYPPPDDLFVLIYGKNHYGRKSHVSVGRYIQRHHNSPYEWRKYIPCCDGGIKMRSVSHWMNFPNPPRIQKKSTFNKQPLLDLIEFTENWKPNFPKKCLLGEIMLIREDDPLEGINNLAGEFNIDSYETQYIFGNRSMIARIAHKHRFPNILGETATDIIKRIEFVIDKNNSG